MLAKKGSVLANDMGLQDDDHVVPQNSENDPYEHEEWEKYEESRWKFPSLPELKVELGGLKLVEPSNAVESMRKKESINLQINILDVPSSQRHSGMATVRL